jgi:hypothetical protein
MSQQGQPIVIARQQLLSVAKAICGMDLSLRPLVAYRVDDLRDLPLIDRKRRLARTDVHAVLIYCRITVAATTSRSAPTAGLMEVANQCASRSKPRAG